MGWNSIAIEVARDHIRSLDMKIKDLHAQLKDLTQQRDHDFNEMQVNCDHDFSPAPGAWAHEGGRCRHCGINELYAPRHRIIHKDLISDGDSVCDEAKDAEQAQQQA